MRGNPHVWFGGGRLEKEVQAYLASRLPYYKAAMLGQDDMSAYFLTEEQTETITILTLPPERGLDWGQSRKVS